MCVCVWGGRGGRGEGEGGGGGGGGFYVRLTDMRVMIQASCTMHLIRARVPVDTAPKKHRPEV